MSEPKKYEPKELLYSMTARCKCGAGLAYPLDVPDALKMRAWFCSRWLLGEIDMEAAPPGSHDAYDFAFFDIKSEGQPSSAGRTTRPPEQGVVHWQPRHECKKCSTKWDGKLCLPADNYRNEQTEKCPNCGEGCHHAEGHSNTNIDSRYETVLVAPAG